jgi:hypothetical protein
VTKDEAEEEILEQYFRADYKIRNPNASKWEVNRYIKNMRAQRTAPKSSPVTVSSGTVEQPTLLRISESSRRREPIGDEVRSFNNSRSSSTAVETIVVRQVSRVSASVDLGRSRALSATAGVKFHNTATAQASLRGQLTRHYSVSMEGELTYEQSTVINIPAHENVEVVFRWYRTWATGMVTIGDLANPSVEVAEAPFEVTVGLAFDKETRDIT